MNNTISVTPRRLMLTGLLVLVAVMTYGFAAANTVDPSNAGDGNAAISGYIVTNVHYTLDPGTPTNVISVGFTLNPPLPSGGTSRISLTGGASWVPAGQCLGTTNVVCTTSVAVSSLNNLQVVAAQ